MNKTIKNKIAAFTKKVGGLNKGVMTIIITLIIIICGQTSMYFSKVLQVKALQDEVITLQAQQDEYNEQQASKDRSSKLEQIEYEDTLSKTKKVIKISITDIQQILNKYDYEHISYVDGEDKKQLVTGLANIKRVGKEKSKLTKPKYGNTDSYEIYYELNNIYDSCSDFVDNFCNGIDNKDARKLSLAAKDVENLIKAIQK